MNNNLNSSICSNLAAVLRSSSLFGQLDEEILRSLEAELNFVSLTSGAVLFRQGDPGDSLYIVISGRLLVSFSPNEQTRRIIDQLGPGEIVGEMALLNDEPRSATVSGLRDTQLAQLTKDGLSRLTAKNPQPIFSAFIRQLSVRLSNKVAGIPQTKSLSVCIAVLPLSPNVPSDFYCHELAKALGRFGATLRLSSELLNDIFGFMGASQTRPEDSGHAPLASWLTEQETHYSTILYQTDTNDSPWTARCLRQADLILLVARHGDDVHEARASLDALSTYSSVGEKREILILLHEEKDAKPTRTACWTESIPAERHFHIRLHFNDDYARLSRFLNRKSVGLALGGGFARGLGHVGVIRAMRELGIPIDMVGGTSMGAIIAGQCSVVWDTSTMLEESSRRSAASLKGDYTLPFVSLLTGKKFSQTIISIANGRDIEDTLIPFFCVSASLTRCEMKVHMSGDAGKSIIASARAPGMFPPLSWNDELLVDGGLVNMVPSSVMREFLDGGTIISVDVSPRIDFEKVDFGLHVSGWRVFWQMCNPFSRKEKMMGIIEILMRILEFGRAPYASPGDHADCHLILPLSQYSHRDFNRGEEMAEVGYQFAKTYFTDWIRKFGRPWQNEAPLQ